MRSVCALSNMRSMTQVAFGPAERIGFSIFETADEAARKSDADDEGNEPSGPVLRGRTSAVSAARALHSNVILSAHSHHAAAAAL
jgi:hypothetical protein